MPVVLMRINFPLCVCFAIFAFGFGAPASVAPLKVVSLDMCADQYALGLLPRENLLGISKRSRHTDSYFQQRAAGVPQRPLSLETLLMLKPDAVIRTWGGDLKLLSGLEARGIKIIQINEVSDFSQAGDEVVRVGEMLGVPQAGRSQRQAMQKALKGAEATGKGRRVLYYTPSAWSAGPETWVGEIFKTLGFTMASEQASYHYLSPEVFIRQSADVYALGFYADAYAMRRVPGRHPLVRKKLETAKAAGKQITVPSAVLACSAWYGAFELKGMASQLK